MQAHSAPLERLRISPDNRYVYSTGQDYVVGIFEVTGKDKPDPREGIQIYYSDDILISQKQRNELQAKIEKLKMDIQIRNAEREQTTQLDIERK